MSRERGSDERGQQRTVAELLAQYGDGAGGNAPRRRRRRADDPSDTAPQAIIDRVVSESGQMRAIRDEPPPPRPPSAHSARSEPGHRSGYRPQPPVQPPPQPSVDRSGPPTRSTLPPVPPGAPGSSIPSMPPVAPPTSSRPSMPPVPPPPGYAGRSRGGPSGWTGEHPVPPSGPLAPPPLPPPVGPKTSGSIPVPPSLGRGGRRPDLDGRSDLGRQDYGRDSRTDLGMGGPSSGPISGPIPAGPPPGDLPSRRNLPPQGRPNTVSSRLDGGMPGPPPDPMTEQLPRVPEGPERTQAAPLPDPYEPDEPQAGLGGPQGPAGPGGSGPRRRSVLPRRGGRSGGFGPGPVPPGTQSQPLPVLPPPDGPNTGNRMPPAGGPDMFPYGGADTTVSHGGGPAPVGPPDTAGPDDFDAFEPAGDDYDDYDDGYDDRDRRGLDDLDDFDDLDEDYGKSPAREWLLMAVQLAGGVLGGAAIWLAFNWLWGVLPAAALVVAIVVTVGLVLVVRKIRRAEDLQTTVLAVLVGLIVTVSPAALLLLKR